jgi:hypothetical protein
MISIFYKDTVGCEPSAVPSRFNEVSFCLDSSKGATSQPS